jgi:hypothetical protein
MTTDEALDLIQEFRPEVDSVMIWDEAGQFSAYEKHTMYYSQIGLEDLIEEVRKGNKRC